MTTIPSETNPPAAGNDNAAPTPIRDTTPLVAHESLVRYVRATLRRYGVEPQNMADAVAEVQADAIEAARTKWMPDTLAEWKALAVTIAARRAIDRLREAEVRDKYDAGLCDDADRYHRPTLHWEHRDPVDTKRYLAILKDLFDSGQMPEDGAEILWGEADEVPHAEIAGELGVSENTVRLRLFRMRAKFHAKLVSLGMLTLLLLLLGVLLAPAGDVAAPAPRAEPAEPAPSVRSIPAQDGGVPGASEDSSAPVKRNRALPD